MHELLVDTRHGRLAMTRQGKGDVVLLLHGIPGSGRSWEQVAHRLAGRATVMVPDLLGFGASDRPQDLGTLHAVGQAQALNEALDALNVDTITVVGHDFGGPVGLMLAAQSPSRVTRLGLLATNAFTDTPVPFPLSLLSRPVLGSILGPFLLSRASLAMMLYAGTGRPRPRLDRESHIGDARQARAIRTLFEGSLRQLDELYAPVQEQLRRWSGPAVVAWGDRDPFFPVEQGRRTADAAGTPLVLLPGAGHFLPEERPEQVTAEIAALLRAPVIISP